MPFWPPAGKKIKTWRSSNVCKTFFFNKVKVVLIYTSRVTNRNSAIQTFEWLQLYFLENWRKKYNLLYSIVYTLLFPGLLTMTKIHKEINHLPDPGDIFSTSLNCLILYIYTYTSFCSGKTIRIQCAHDAITMIVPPFLNLLIQAFLYIYIYYSGCRIISESLKKGLGDNQISGIAGLFASPTPDTRRIQISPLRMNEGYGKGTFWMRTWSKCRNTWKCQRGLLFFVPNVIIR